MLFSLFPFQYDTSIPLLVNAKSRSRIISFLLSSFIPQIFLSKCLETYGLY